MREKIKDKRLIKRRLLSLFLAVLMLIGTLPLSPLKVYAIEPSDGYPSVDPIDPGNRLAKYYDDYIAFMSMFIDPNLKKAIQEKFPSDVDQITLGDYIKYIGTRLDINNRGIKSLRGIEQFGYFEYTPKNVTVKRPLLKVLNCDDNEITSIDLTKNPYIFILSCNGNKISNLKLNSEIEYLNCNKNLITNLNISQSKSLL